MAHIFYVKVRYAEHRDDRNGYPIIERRPVGVEVVIHLTIEEAMLIHGNRKGDRRLTTLLGPAIRWEFHSGQRLNPPWVAAHHSIDSNPHGIRTPYLIAERTLTSLKALLTSLRSPG